MGYYTGYELSFSEYRPEQNGWQYTTTFLSEDQYEQLSREIDIMNVFESGSVEDGYYGYVKWYDWEQDMVMLSQKFPNVLFRLHGDGEDSNDLWDAYILNGQIQHCHAQIIYDDFDPAKLQTFAYARRSNNADEPYKYSYQN